MATTAQGQSLFAARTGRIEVSATMAINAEAVRLRSEGDRPGQLRRGRAALQHAAAHQGRGHRGDRKNFSRYTAVAGTVPRCARPLRAPRRRLRLQLHHRRVRLQPLWAASWPFSTRSRCWWTTAMRSSCRCRTGSRSRTSSSTRAARWCLWRRDEREDFRITGEDDRGGDYAQDEGDYFELAVEPLGRGGVGGGPGGIVRLAHARGIYLLLDECYAYLTYTGVPVSGGTFTDCKDHVIILGSLSKTYAMTGWRAGLYPGPEADHLGDEQAAVAEHVEPDQRLCRRRRLPR
jgi:aspartate aminotransferase